MARWGTMVYSDGTPVPLRIDRCRSALPGDGPHHGCKKDKSHTEDEHKCICGAKWVTENA